MAITCPQCGAGFDVTLFQFGHRITCNCGAVLEYPGGDSLGGHRLPVPTNRGEDKLMTEVEIGKITHYFSKINVAAIEITQDSLSVGERVHIKGHTSDFMQDIGSMQIDGQSVDEATVGQSVAIRVDQHAREHDQVLKVVE